MPDKEQAVLAANDAFYNAFIHNDYAGMERLWAAAHDIVVIHPGWPPLHGRRSVLDSWQRILADEGTNRMQYSEAVAYLDGNMAFVVCSENFPEGELVATNIFVLEDDDWRMVHHHSGPNPAAGGAGRSDAVH